MLEKYRLVGIVTAAALSFIVYLFIRQRANHPEHAVVTAPVARATYADQGKIALDDEVFHGQTVSLLALPTAEGLVAARTQYGYNVMLPATAIRRSTAAVERWRGMAGHVVAAPWAAVCERADLRSFPSLLTLPRGSVVAVVGKETETRPGGKEYAKVELADGRTGFVRPESLREFRQWNGGGEEETRRRVVADALSYLGVEYAWGGKSPAGIDCSGLASIAYMLNGLDIYRNSRPQPGFPIALLHVPANARGGFDLETLEAGGAKPGDLIYWSGHMAVYLGGGKYVHANGTSYDVRVNSLLEGEADYREDLGKPEKVFAWGTAWPAEPERLVVKEFRAVQVAVNKNAKEGVKEKDTVQDGRVYRFYAKASGYTPTRAVVYPEGIGADKPKIETNNPRFMLYDAPDSAHDAVPRYRYAQPGVYKPALELVNDTGWRPDGKEIRSEVFVLEEGLRVE